MLEISGKLNLVVNLNQSLGFFYISSIFFPLDVIRSQLGVRKEGGGGEGGGCHRWVSVLAKYVSLENRRISGAERERRYASARR